MSLCYFIDDFAFPNPFLPWLIWENAVETPHLFIAPQAFVNRPRRLQRVVYPGQRLPHPFEEGGEEVLIGKRECGDKR